jgi:hypothetical protein
LALVREKEKEKERKRKKEKEKKKKKKNRNERSRSKANLYKQTKATTQLVVAGNAAGNVVLQAAPSTSALQVTCKQFFIFLNFKYYYYLCEL